MVEVVTCDDPVERAVSRLAAWVEELAALRGERELVRLVITGGSADQAVAPLFARLATRGVPPSRLALTWSDERCVPRASADSNRGALALPAGLGAVLPLFEDGESPERAVSRCDAVLRDTFGGAVDVALLGLGEDGHVASLFPGRRPHDGLVAHVADSPKPPPDRITLTRGLLATARHVLVLAWGEGKRDACERLAAGDPSLPASGLPGLVLVTDLDLETSP